MAGEFSCGQRVSWCRCVPFSQDTLCWSVGSYPAPTPFSRALHEWIGIVCEYRVFFYDYMTHEVRRHRRGVANGGPPFDIHSALAQAP